MDNNETVKHEDTENGTKGEQELLQLVGFNLSGEEYGIDILKVQEIIRMLSITKVPNAPAFVEGVINLRGKVLPVISLRNKFGLEEKAHDKRTRIMVVNIANRILGVVVDSVSEVLRLPVDTVQPAPEVVSGKGKDSDYIKGIGKLDERMLILLDLERIFDKDAQKIMDVAA